MKKALAMLAAIAVVVSGSVFASAAHADVVHGSDESCTPVPAKEAVYETQHLFAKWKWEPGTALEDKTKEHIAAYTTPTASNEWGAWDDHPDPKWEDDGWNADDLAQSSGWQFTGTTREVVVEEGSDAVLCEWYTWDTNAWTPDATDSSGVNWPQSLVGAGKIAPTQCETTYQQDLYQGTREQIDAVLDGDELTNGEDSGVVKAWVVVSTDECIEEEPPPPVVNVCADVLDGDTSTNLNDLWVNVDTRATGHVEYVEGGLHVWTEGSTSTDKVSEGRGLGFPLKNTGTLDIDATAQVGNVYPYGPGLNLFVDFDNDGSLDGTLVYEEVYGQDLWLTNGSKQFVKDAAPSHTGGNGSENHGTINQWLTVFPNAQVQGFAYALGSGVHGNWVITKVTVGCADFTFDFDEPTQEPEVVTPEEPVSVDPCGPDNLDVTVPEDTDAVDYTVVVNEDGSVTVTATPKQGFVFAEGTQDEWTFTESGVVCPPDDEEPPVEEPPAEEEPPTDDGTPPPAKPVTRTPSYTG